MEKMVNTKAIKIRMLECNKSMLDLSKSLNLAPVTVRSKISNNRAFTLEEAEKIQKELNIPDELFTYYFFQKESHSATGEQ